MKISRHASLLFGVLALATHLAAQTNSFPSTGMVGIGSGNPLNLANGLGHPPYVIGTWTDNNNSGIDFHAFANSVDTKALSIIPGTGNIGIWNTLYLAASLSHPPYMVGTWTDNNNTGIDFHAFANFADKTALSIQPGTANVGIGTTSPGAALEVNGNVRLTSGSGASLTFADGTTQSTAYTGTCTATGGDYAESVDVTGDKSGYEPGDVIVLDPESPGHFLLSSEPYSLLVAGIYSTKPGYVGRRQKGDPKLAKAEIPMAMIGIVPTKATTENGPIKIGDQLVTSSRPGYVMKGTDRTQMNGSVVGKAMGALKSGAGVIEVLVSLQ